MPNFCCCRIFGWCRIFYNGLFWVPILRCRIFSRICLESFYLWKCQFLCVAKIRQKIRHLKTVSRNSDSEGFKFLDIRGAPDRALGPDPAHEETLRWAWARPGPWPFRVSGRWVYEGPWALARHTRKIDSHAKPNPRTEWIERLLFVYQRHWEFGFRTHLSGYPFFHRIICVVIADLSVPCAAPMTKTVH